MLLGPIHQALNIFSSSFMVVLKILDLEKENILLLYKSYSSLFISERILVGELETYYISKQAVFMHYY